MLLQRRFVPPGPGECRLAHKRLGENGIISRADKTEWSRCGQTPAHMVLAGFDLLPQGTDAGSAGFSWRGSGRFDSPT